MDAGGRLSNFGVKNARTRAGVRGVALIDLLFAGGAVAFLVVLLLARGASADREMSGAKGPGTVGAEGGAVRPR